MLQLETFPVSEGLFIVALVTTLLNFELLIDKNCVSFFLFSMGRSSESGTVVTEEMLDD